MNDQTTTLLSTGTHGEASNGNSADPRISSDGRFIAFFSAATNLVEDDVKGGLKFFVHDSLGGSTTRATIQQDEMPDSVDEIFGISDDGRNLFLLGYVDGGLSLMQLDLEFGTLTAAPIPVTPNAISSDGKFAVFESAGSGLIAGDTSHGNTVLVFDAERRAVIPVFESTPSLSAQMGSSTISADGRFVAFCANVAPDSTPDAPTAVVVFAVVPR